jgi:hypothetical protein
MLNTSSEFLVEVIIIIRVIRVLITKIYTNDISVITKLPNSEQSYKGKVKTHMEVSVT